MTADNITIRQATVDDLQRLSELWLEFMEFHTEREPDLALSADAGDRWAKWAAQKVADDKGFIAVAEAGGKIIGYVIAKITDRSDVFRERTYGEIMELAVTSSARAAGAGTRLYESATEWVRSKGVGWLQLEVSSANETADAFWAKKGFKPFVERRTLRI